MLSVSPSKNFQYIDTSMASTATPNMSGRTSVVSEEGSLAFRYSDASDKSKPLLARPGQPAMLWTHETIVEETEEPQYASLPFQKQQPMTTFRDPPQLPPRPVPPESRPFAYDEKGLLCHTPPHTSSGNVFCKVDVHHNDNSDSYDEFCIRPQHVWYVELFCNFSLFFMSQYLPIELTDRQSVRSTRIRHKFECQVIWYTDLNVYYLTFRSISQCLR